MPPKRKALDELNPDAVQQIPRIVADLPPVPLYDALETAAFDHEAHSLLPTPPSGPLPASEAYFLLEVWQIFKACKNLES